MRLQYLKSSVTGEAAKLISGISVTEANYEGAWTALAQRYDNKGLILAHHFNQLSSLRAVHTETAANLKYLRDTISESRRAMKNLGRPVEYWDDWFVHITVQRLNHSSRKDWETTRGITKDIPTYADLMNFLDSRIRALEAVPPPVMPNERTRNRNFVPPNLRSHASTMQSPGSTKANQSCELCDENHYLGHCPEFKRKTPLQRKDIVIRLKRCLNCLNKHATNSCPSAHKCFVCHKAHHTLLHDMHSATPSISTAHVLMPPNVPVTSTLLATAIIRVTAPNGNSSLIRALLDQGSEATFISEDLTQRLHLQRTKVHIPVTGLGATPCGTVKALVRVQLSPTHKNYSSTVSAEAYVLSHLTKTFPPRRISTHSWPHLKALTLSDPGSSSFSKIDLVIGADLYGHILLDGFIKGPPGTPIAQNTIFGWVLSGKVQESSPDSQPGEVTAHHCSLDLTLTEELMKFWEIEELNQRPPLTPEELQCEEHFQTTHSRDPDGRFVVRLPKRSDVPLGNSHLYAVRSLQRNELRRLQDESLNQAYRQFMKEYLELGHMAVVSAASAPTGQSFYLPHHAVWKFEGSSPKLRVVFNASARTSSGFSLNDYLLPGPKLQQEIGHVLIRWRTHAVALTSDIVKMFRQISVHPEDQPLQRILWRDTPDQELQTFQLQTVTYGTTCASYLAIRCLHQLARDEVDKFPEASKILQTQTYVDDILFGAETEERALALKTQLEGLLTAGGFQLAKWSSNCPDLAGSDNSPHVLSSDGTVKTLGILWNPRTDNFEFQIKLETPEKITKRSTLSCIAKLFDPLGWLAPVLISAKIFIQDLWTVKCDWDTALPPSLEAVWSLYYSSLTQLRDLRIPRWISYSPETSWELHGFCDASQRAYAASVYVRTETAPGIFRTHLLTAKTKVAPLKVISLPRLELSGAVLLIRLLKHVCDAMQLSSSPCVHAWTDSQVVLHWINAVPARWKCFVANRVSEIHQKLPQTIWHHVNSADNPADPASRGVPAASIKDNSLWWHGPHWLSKFSTSWPPSTIAPFSPEALQEESLRVQTFNTIISEPWNLSERYSSLTRLIRVTSWLFRFTDNARVPKEMRNLEPLSVPELTKSHWYWIKKVQQQQFAEEIGMLRCGRPTPKRGPIFRLCPLLDPEGILRVGGRLEHSPLSYDERHPVILSSKAHFVRLLAEDCHLRTLHGGPQLTLNQLQGRYWIVGGRNLVRKIIRTCITCLRYSRGPSEVPLMGQLPAARVSPARPFFHSGLDYAGPIRLRHSKGRGRLTSKGPVVKLCKLPVQSANVE